MLKLSLRIAVVVALTGCTAPTERTAEPTKQPSTPDQSLSTLLIRAEQTDEPTATEFRLAAAAQALDLGDANQAQQVLALISNPYAIASTSIDYLILAARTAVKLGDAKSTLSYLEDPRLQSTTLTVDQQISIGRTRSDAYLQTRSFVASARERIYLNRLIEESELLENHEQIFGSLIKVPARSLTAQANRAITSDVRGWLSLAALTKMYQNDPLRQLEELNRWKRAWSHHPAARIPPRTLEMLSRVVTEQPSIIALLLPLQGNLSPVGQAIRDGFIAAHYEQNGSAEIIIYDTTTASAKELVNRAKAQGVELIIGPLSKEEVTDVASLDLDIPVLALNRSSDNSLNPNLYQFGLAPEDEIIQVTEQVHSEGLKHALVIYQEGAWGSRNFLAFEHNWSKKGGTIVDTATFTNQRDFSDLVKGLLDIDSSEKRAADLRRIIGERFEFTPRRRKDIDFVFLLTSNPGPARGINPTLEHFYAEDIPVYATSHIYESSESWIDAIDLDGIRFCDIPWKLASFDTVQQQIQSTWSSAIGQLAPFYAVGLDAYRLYPRLQQLKELPDETLFGATGSLRLNQNNVIERELMWARFKDGKPVSTPMITQ